MIFEYKIEHYRIYQEPCVIIVSDAQADSFVRSMNHIGGLLAVASYCGTSGCQDLHPV